MTVSIISWNIAHRREAWLRLFAIDPSIALLQEACPPPQELQIDGSRVAAPPDDQWKVTVRGVSPHGAAVVCLDQALEFSAIEPKPLAEATPDELSASHPGQFAVGRFLLPGGDALTIVSLYAIWERQAGLGIYSEASLHRALSDLTPLMQGKDPLLIAGDLNIFHGYTLAGEAYWLPRYESVFQRLEAYGLGLIGPNPAEDRGALPDCRCRGASCRHVRTYRHQYKAESRPDQLDFVFANRALQERVLSSIALDDEENWAVSDHCPILTVLDA